MLIMWNFWQNFIETWWQNQREGMGRSPDSLAGLNNKQLARQTTILTLSGRGESLKKGIIIENKRTTEQFI